MLDTGRAPVTSDDDLLGLLRQGLTYIRRALCYWWRRTREQPAVGLLYALTYLASAFLLIQDAHQLLALQFTTPYQFVEPEWPLAGKPLPLPFVFGLLAVALVVSFLDHTVLARYQPPTGSARPVQVDEWVVGTVVARTWHPDPGAWHTQATSTPFTLAANHLRVHLLVVAPPGAGKPSAPQEALTSQLDQEASHIWQTPLIHLHLAVPADDYNRVLRYATLLELDRPHGAALLALPADYMREQVAGRLAGPIAAVLGQLCGTSIQVFAAVLPGQGRLAAQRPSLATLLAQCANQGERG